MDSQSSHSEHDDLDDPAYHIHILWLMINELPPGMRTSISDQFNHLLAAIDKQNQQVVKFWAKVKDELTTLGVDLKYIEFDLEATKRERDDLQDRLDGLS